LRPSSAGGAVAEARSPADPSSKARGAVERPQPAEDPELATQNRLFADAMNARARGDLSGAVRLLDRLLRRYPSSVLGEDARVERFRALARLGDHRGASAAARAYLQVYPGGFARDEAHQLASGDR
jgi:outer membrane protein assembly factor BamD (BamD/ComL family)